jgi:hypothetical protein
MWALYQKLTQAFASDSASFAMMQPVWSSRILQDPRIGRTIFRCKSYGKSHDFPSEALVTRLV